MLRAERAAPLVTSLLPRSSFSPAFPKPGAIFRSDSPHTTHRPAHIIWVDPRNRTTATPGTCDGHNVFITKLLAKQLGDFAGF